jgi:hypothetical protein
MKILSIESQKFDYLKALHIIFFAIMMTSCMLNSSNVRAAVVVPSDTHLIAAVDLSSGTLQFAATFKMRPPRRLKRPYPLATDPERQ